MGSVYDRSTYAQLIDDLRFDLNLGAELASVPDEGFQVWILRAESDIANRIPIRQEYSLALTTGVSDYYLRDRPPITGATNAEPIVITAAAHGLVNGDEVYVSGVLGNMAANGSFTVTRLTADTFSLGDSTGNGTYSSGGRFWKTDEVPSYFRRIYEATRTWSGIVLPMRPVDIRNIAERQASDEYNAFTGYTAPEMFALMQKDGVRYLKFYPTPTEDQTATLFGWLSIVPKDYTSDPLTTQIHLTSNFNELIKQHVRVAVFTYLRDRESAAMERAVYVSLLRDSIWSLETDMRIRMRYD